MFSARSHVLDTGTRALLATRVSYFLDGICNGTLLLKSVCIIMASDLLVPDPADQLMV